MNTPFMSTSDRIAERIRNSRLPLTVYLATSGDVRCSARADVDELPSLRVVGTYCRGDSFNPATLCEDIAATFAAVRANKAKKRGEA